MELASITLPGCSDVSLAVTTPCQLQPCMCYVAELASCLIPATQYRLIWSQQPNPNKTTESTQ